MFNYAYCDFMFVICLTNTSCCMVSSGTSQVCSDAGLFLLSVADDNLSCDIHLLFSDIHYMEITTAHCIMLLPLIPFSAVDFVSS